MKLKLASIVIGALMTAVPLSASAQTISPATSEARGRLACGGMTLVSAEYIGSQLRVTCSQESDQSRNSPSDAALLGTGLLTPAAAGVLLAIGVVALVGGTGNDPTVVSTTTTTTTTTAPSVER